MPFASAALSESPLEMNGWDRAPVPFWTAVGDSFNYHTQVTNTGVRRDTLQWELVRRNSAIRSLTGEDLTPEVVKMQHWQMTAGAPGAAAVNMEPVMESQGMDTDEYEQKVLDLRRRRPDLVNVIKTREEIAAEVRARLDKLAMRGQFAEADHPVAGFLGATFSAPFDRFQGPAMMATGVIGAGRTVLAKAAISAGLFGGATALSVPGRVADSQYGGGEFTYKEGLKETAWAAGAGALFEVGGWAAGKAWRGFKARLPSRVSGGAEAELDDVTRGAANALESEDLAEKALGPVQHGEDGETARIALEAAGPKPEIEPEKSLEELFPDAVPEAVELLDQAAPPTGELPAPVEAPPPAPVAAPHQVEPPPVAAPAAEHPPAAGPGAEPEWRDAFTLSVDQDGANKVEWHNPAEAPPAAEGAAHQAAPPAAEPAVQLAPPAAGEAAHSLDVDGLELPDQAHLAVYQLGKDLAEGKLKPGSPAARERASALLQSFGRWMDWSEDAPAPKGKRIIGKPGGRYPPQERPAWEPKAKHMLTAAREYYEQSVEAGSAGSLVDPELAGQYIQERAGGVALSAARPTPAMRSATYRGRDIHATQFSPDELTAAPELFQYKAGGDAAGVTSRLKGVGTWDAPSSGKVMVWEDQHGRRWIADGHQRLGFAKRLAEEGASDVRLDGYLFRAADGWDAAEVRVLAALKNIREGSGSALDAAKVFREAPAMMDDPSLPRMGEHITQAKALARLSEDAFGAVVNKVIPERYAALIGQLAPDRAELHGGLVNLLAKAEPRNMDEAAGIIKEALEDEWRQREGGTVDMFGDAPAESLVIARGKVKAAAMKALSQDAKIFGQLVRHADAIEAGGNALARNSNEAEVGLASAALEVIGKLAMRAGPLGEAMGRAAAKVADGAKPGAVVHDLVAAIKRELAAGERLEAIRGEAINPPAPTEQATARLNDFDQVAGKGQASQLKPKPEEAEIEAGTAPDMALSLFDDLPEKADHSLLKERLNPCAPGA